jgi:cyclopropane fatty-acyl-phospholipid synthase-like methyltransferase
MIDVINKVYKIKDGIYYSVNGNEDKGYWSNISVKDQEGFLSECRTIGTLKSVRENFPNLESVIFEPTRAVGLRFLDIKSDDIGVDFGCMWGNLLIHSAKKCKLIVGIDQTEASLKFLNIRLKEEKLDNVCLINDNLRNILPFRKNFDFAIINGVLEWIPDTNQIDLTNFFNKGKVNILKNQPNPKESQLEFLKTVHQSLNDKGKLYLAIENRWDYQHFLWKRDPHSDLFYTAILPRKISSLISKIVYGRSYVNYIYSMKELKQLLSSAGFIITEKYAAFPDYRSPITILDMNTKDTSDYSPVYHISQTNNILKKAFRKGRNLLDKIIYKYFKLFNLAPSFIIIAEKRNR